MFDGILTRNTVALILLSAITSAAMSGAVSGAMTFKIMGLSKASIAVWANGWATAWPIAFLVIFSVGPFFRKSIYSLCNCDSDSRPQ